MNFPLPLIDQLLAHELQSAQAQATVRDKGELMKAPNDRRYSSDVEQYCRRYPASGNLLNKTGGRQRLNVSLRSNGIAITQPETAREIRLELSGQRLEVEQSLGEWKDHAKRLTGSSKITSNQWTDQLL